MNNQPFLHLALETIARSQKGSRNTGPVTSRNCRGETQSDSEAEKKMTEEEYTRLSNLVSATVDQQAQFSEDLRTIGEGIRALLAIAEIHESEIGELREAGKATDERLNTLINVVERQISERNGKQ